MEHYLAGNKERRVLNDITMSIEQDFINLFYLKKSVLI